MIRVAVDVGYGDGVARAAAVAFAEWPDAEPLGVWTATTPVAADYVPGAFHLRELPPILAVLARVDLRVSTVLVDGHVDLGPDRPGLGRRLSDAAGVAVVGVAKTAFRGAPALAVVRGAARRPLWVTSTGDVGEAAAGVAAMAGPYRIPALLALADRLSRQAGG